MQTPRFAKALPRATLACRPSALLTNVQSRMVPPIVTFSPSPARLQLQARRWYSGPVLDELDAKAKDRPRGLRISHLFGALALMGMFVTTYGL